KREPAHYEPLDHFLIRTPALPVEVYRSLSESACLDDPLAAVDATATRSLVECALAVGSHDLLGALERARARGRPPASRARGRLLRCLIRMSTRPPPSGLFAGVGLGAGGAATDISLVGPPRPRTRPDMGWLLACVGALEARVEIRRHLRLVANSAAFVRSGR